MLGFLIALGILAFALECADRIVAASAQALAEQPPDRFVSDEEFLAAIPDVPENVALGVRQVLADTLLIHPNSIHPGDRLIDDLGFE